MADRQDPNIGYGTVGPTVRHGIGIYAPPTGLRRISEAVKSLQGDVVLADRPASFVVGTALRSIHVVEANGPIFFRVDGDTVEIAGDVRSREILAATILNLANSPFLEGPVLRHVDLAYFPGHGFVGDSDVWMTFSLLPEDDPAT